MLQSRFIHLLEQADTQILMNPISHLPHLGSKRFQFFNMFYKAKIHTLFFYTFYMFYTANIRALLFYTFYMFYMANIHTHFLLLVLHG